MRKKRLDEREQRRIATRLERHGPDFDSKNGRHAAQFNKTKFNSASGKAAAKKRWEDYRAEQARKAAQNG